MGWVVKLFVILGKVYRVGEIRRRESGWRENRVWVKGKFREVGVSGLVLLVDCLFTWR